MSEDVMFKVSADANSALSEVSKLNDKINRLTDSLEKMNSKTKQTKDFGKGAFSDISFSMESMIKNLGVSFLVLSQIKAEFSAIGKESKLIRDLKDISSKEVDKSSTNLFLEGNVDDKNKQYMLRLKIKERAKTKGMALQDVEGIYKSAFNAGSTLKDINEDKLESALDIVSITGSKDYDQIVSNQNSARNKLGLKNTRENNKIVNSKLIEIFGKDQGNVKKLGQLNFKKDEFDKVAILLDYIESEKRFGNLKASASEIDKAFSKGGGGFNKAFKDSGMPKELLEERLKTDYLKSFESKKNIYQSSIEAVDYKIKSLELITNDSPNTITEEQKRKFYENRNRAKGTNVGFMTNVRANRIRESAVGNFLDEDTIQKEASSYQTGSLKDFDNSQEEIKTLIYGTKKVMETITNTNSANLGNKDIKKDSDTKAIK